MTSQARPDMAKLYTKIRGSRWFLFGLTGFIGTWMAGHFMFGWDGTWGVLNLVLSAEASVSLAFFAMISDQQERAASARMDQMIKLLELSDKIDAHSKKLDEHIERVALHALAMKLRKD